MSFVRIRILNFDDSVTRQKRLLADYDAEIIDMRDLGPGARFWMNRGVASKIEKRLPSRPTRTVTFLGSGDFHNVTDMLISRYDEPICVIDFDFHPDWDILFPMPHCGSWAARAMRRPNVLKLIMLGVSSRDLLPFSIHTGDLGSLKDDRIEIYPYSQKPAYVFLRRVPQNISIATTRYPFVTKILWNGLKDKNITEFLLHIIKRLPSKKVYVTVDKDCLRADYALTNWEEGAFSLDDLLVMLKILKDNLDIVGMDITGDYSAIQLAGIFKRFASYLDHTKRLKASELALSRIDEINERTNLKILELINS